MKETVEKTYGVRGLMEWSILFPLPWEKDAYIEVNFTGGQITGYGISPAKYTTRDPYIQSVIEKSPMFANRKIYLIKSVKYENKD